MRRLPPAIITAVVFVAGFAICAMQFPHMASTRVVANLLTDNAFLGIVATGMTFVIISGGIDLSVGSVIGFTTVFVALDGERDEADADASTGAFFQDHRRRLPPPSKPQPVTWRGPPRSADRGRRLDRCRIRSRRA